MIPPPIALGLTLCENVVIEEGTKNITLVNSFTKLLAEEFPSPSRQFALYAALTDGVGSATVNVTLTDLDTDEVVYQVESPLHFPDRLTEVQVIFWIDDCVFPIAGRYQWTLLIDGDPVTQRVLHVAAAEE